MISLTYILKKIYLIHFSRPLCVVAVVVVVSEVDLVRLEPERVRPNLAGATRHHL